MTAAQKTIDTHTHILADATIKLLQKEIPKLGLKLTPYDDDNSVIEVAGVPYRPFPRGGHNIERRLRRHGCRRSRRACALGVAADLAV